MADERFSPQEFGLAFQRFMEWAAEAAQSERSPFKTMLTDHFGEDAGTFPVTGDSIAPYDLPNLQLALDAYLEREGVAHRLVGFGGHLGFAEMSLAGLVHDFGFGLAVGPVRRTPVALGEDRSMTCVTTGLFLISAPEHRLAALVMQGRHGFDEPGLRLEVIAAEQDDGERFLAEIRSLMRERNVYRGKVLALVGGDQMMHQGMSVEFPAIEPVSPEQIVLPKGVLDTVELHTVEFARHSEALRAAGRHLRRGLLLHGPPGTGKTLSSSYLISRLEGRTVIVLTGAALALVADACAIARDLQPSMVVLEDVDLVAQERTAMGLGATSVLFQLLNEMDGIGEDADVIFLMTTNRADLLEPALAARPGRVDQAVELPLPDADARARLIELFCVDLDVSLRKRDTIVAETEGPGVPSRAGEEGRPPRRAVRRARRRQPLPRGAGPARARGPITRTLLGGDGRRAVAQLPDEDEWAG